MSRGSSRLCLIGLAFLLFSLLEPFTVPLTVAGDVSPSDMAATPGAEPTTGMATGEPFPEPPVEMQPTDPTEPLVEPTIVPAEKPTAETLPAEPASEPAAPPTEREPESMEPSEEPVTAPMNRQKASSEPADMPCGASHSAQPDTGSPATTIDCTFQPAEHSLAPAEAVTISVSGPESIDIAALDDLGTVAYRIEVSNTSEHAAENIGFRIEGASGSMPVWAVSGDAECRGTDDRECVISHLGPKTKATVSVTRNFVRSCDDLPIVTATLTRGGIGSSSFRSACVSPAPEISIEKSPQVDMIQQNHTPRFSYTLRNAGTAEANGIAFTDPLPPGPKWVIPSGSGDGKCEIHRGDIDTLECDGIDLGVGDTFSVAISGYEYPPENYPAPACGDEYTSTATLTAGGTGSSTGTIYVVCDWWSLTISPRESTVVAGEEISLAITAQNNAIEPYAADLEIDTGYARGPAWSVDRMDICGLRSASANVFDCDDILFGERDVEVITLTATAPADVCGTKLQIGAVLTPHKREAGTHSPGPITAVGEVTVSCSKPEPDVTIDMTGNPETIFQGQKPTFIIRLTNNTDVTQSGIALESQLPDGGGQLFWRAQGHDCERDADQLLSCEDIEIAPNGSVEIDVVTNGAYTLNCDVALESSAWLIQESDDVATARIDVECLDLSISIDPDATEVSSGSNIGAAITVSNDSGIDAEHVQFGGKLPVFPGQDWSTTTDDCEVWGVDDRYLACNGVTIPAHSSITVEINSPTSVASCAEHEFAMSISRPHKVDATSVSIEVTGCPAPAPDVSMAMTPDPATISPGDPVRFTINMANDGAAPSGQMTLIHRLPTIDGSGAWKLAAATGGGGILCEIKDDDDGQYFECIIPDLEPTQGGSVTVEHATTLRTCGTFESTATLISDGEVHSTASAAVQLICPVLEITKVAEPDTIYRGDEPRFTITVTNAGTEPVVGAAFEDRLPYEGGLFWRMRPSVDGCTLNDGDVHDEVLVCSGIDLDPGESFTVHIGERDREYDYCPATLESTARLTAGGEGEAKATITVLCPEPAIAITRTITPEVVRMGDEVTFAFEITNTGNVLLENIDVASYGIGSGFCRLDVLPAATGDGDDHVHRCTASRTVTPNDVSDGWFTSGWAVVNAIYDGKSVTASAERTRIRVESDDAHKLSVTTEPIEVTVGDPVSFTIALENTGQLTSGYYGMQAQLPDLGVEPAWEITSSLFGGPCAIAIEDDGNHLDCFAYPLPPQTTASVTFQHPTSLETCGEFTTSAVLYYANADVHSRGSASARVLCPELAVEFTADPATDEDVREGDEIAYTLTITNTSDVPLKNVTVDTNIAGLADDPIGDLGAESRVTLDATSIVTADDVAAGEIIRSVTVRGEASTGVEAPAYPATLTHRVVQEPSIDLEITGEHQAPSDDEPLGSIAITFVVTNSGDSTLTGTRVFAALLGDDYLPVGTLGPGEDATVTATWALTQADLDAGSLLIDASASGMPPGDRAGVNTWAETTMTIPQHPTIALVHTVTGVIASDGEDRNLDPDEPVIGLQAGDVVAYRLVATNAGNVTLAEVEITAPLPVGLSCDEVVPLSPMEEVACTGTYTVTQDDIDTGEPIVSAATVAGVPPQGDPVAADASVTVWPEIQRPELAIALTAAVDDGGMRTPVDAPAPIIGLDAGDTVTFALVVANAGNVTLGEIGIDAPLLRDLDCDGAESLGPGEVIRCTGSYTVMQAEIDAGEPVIVVARATSEATGPVEASGTLGLVAAIPGISLVQSGSAANGVGDVVTWTLVATNTGNVTLSDVVITAGLPGLPVPDCDGGSTLARGEMVTCTATSPVTQADVDAGVVTSEAVVLGMPPAGASVVIDRTSASVALAQESGLTVVLSADVGAAAAGNVITYTIEVTNTGTVTMASVVVASPDGLVWSEAHPDGIVGDLAPGETRMLLATHMVTDGDAARGDVAMQVWVTGGGHEGAIMATSATVWVAVAQPAPEPTPTPEPTGTPIPPLDATPVPDVIPAPVEGATPVPEGEAKDSPISELPRTGSGAGSASWLTLAGLLVAATLLGIAGLGVRPGLRWRRHLMVSGERGATR